MHTRIRVPLDAHPTLMNNIPLLEAGDLPGDDDWAIVESLRRDPLGEEDPDMSFHLDLD